VPEGLLDAVMAEAERAAAAAPPVAVGSSESVWTRLRRSFVLPAIALAGTAVLVLWIGRPGDDLSLADPEPASTAKTRVPSTVRLEFIEEEDLDAEPAAAAPAPAGAPDDRQKTKFGDSEDPLGGIEWPDSTPDEITAKGEEPEPEPELELKEEAKSAEAGGGAPAGPATGRWDIVSRGDRARQAGDCIGAREEYALALEDDEARVRARALAGLGLCDQLEGNSPSADANFERARALDGGIDGFIESQRKRSGSKRRSKKKPSSKARKSMDPLNADPFD